jgi:hypothetical protein
MTQMIPRGVGFDKDGIAVCAGNPVYVASNVVTRKVIELPSTHYDFIDYDVRGKTEAQIRADMEVYNANT